MPAIDNLDVLEYRVNQLEKMFEPLLKLVNDLDRKIALLTQKMIIATVIAGAIINGIGIWYGANAGKESSEPEKKTNYEYSVNDSGKIKELNAEIERLKKGVR